MGRITELQEEVSRRKNHIAQLDHQIHTLNENISTLTKELELKGKEVLKIRSEANQQIRYDSAVRNVKQYKTIQYNTDHKGKIEPEFITTDLQNFFKHFPTQLSEPFIL